MLKTAFWQDAARSLHPSVRQRYLAYFEYAERWELALDAALELWARARIRLNKAFQTIPRRIPHEL